jgi:hypothetical protein
MMLNSSTGADNAISPGCLAIVPGAMDVLGARPFTMRGALVALRPGPTTQIVVVLACA